MTSEGPDEAWHAHDDLNMSIFVHIQIIILRMFYDSFSLDAVQIIFFTSSRNDTLAPLFYPIIFIQPQSYKNEILENEMIIQ